MESGFCKIEYTPEQAQEVINFRQRMLQEQEECQDRIKNGDFDVTKKRRFLFFTLTSTYTDSYLCKQAYPDLFDYATTFDWDGAIGVYTNQSFESLSSMVRLLKTNGEVYLNPQQCTIFRNITK